MVPAKLGCFSLGRIFIGAPMMADSALRKILWAIRVRFIKRRTRAEKI